MVAQNLCAVTTCNGAQITMFPVCLQHIVQVGELMVANVGAWAYGRSMNYVVSSLGVTAVETKAAGRNTAIFCFPPF